MNVPGIMDLRVTIAHLIKWGWAHLVIIALRALLWLWPHHCPTWRLVGHWLVVQRRFGDALTFLNHTLEQPCANAQTYADLALVYRHSHRLTAAEQALRQAIEREPDQGVHWLELGDLLMQRQHVEPAIHAFERAIHLQPDRVEPLFHLARLYLSLERVDAVRCEYLCRRALKIDPEHEGCLSLLAKALNVLGQLDEATSIHHRILQRNPRDAGALESLAALGQLPKDLTRDKLPATASKDMHELAYHHFVRAKVSLSLGDPTEAFSWYQAGNQIMRRGFFYDIHQDAQFFQRIQSVFDARFFAERQGWGHSSAKPIFILGMPRSGTTLVEQIVAAHPQCHGGGERTDIHECAQSMGLLSRTHQVFPEAARELTMETACILGESHVQGLTLLNRDALRVTDKLPHNFLHLGLIHLLLPHARIIHCRRHPMDICFSCYQQMFANHHPYAYDLVELGRYYRMYHHLMNHWRHILPGRMLELHYETIIRQPEATIRGILDHCGLSWDARCLDFHKSTRQVDTASLLEVRQPLYPTSMGKWHRFERELQPLRDALGDVLDD